MTSTPDAERLVTLTRDGDPNAAAALLKLAERKGDPALLAIALAGGNPDQSAWFRLTTILQQNPSLVALGLDDLLEQWPDTLRRFPGLSSGLWLGEEPWPAITPLCRYLYIEADDFPQFYRLNLITRVRDPLCQRYSALNFWEPLAAIRTLHLDANVPMGFRARHQFDRQGDLKESAISDNAHTLLQDLIPAHIFCDLLLAPAFAQVTHLAVADETDGLLNAWIPYTERLEAAPILQSLQHLKLSASSPSAPAFMWLSKSKLREVEISYAFCLGYLDTLLPPKGPESLRVIRLGNVKHYNISPKQQEHIRRSSVRVTRGKDPDWI